MTEPYRAGGRIGEVGRLTARLGAAAALASWLGACSFAIPSLLAEEPEVTTGSVAPSGRSPLSPDLDPEDWRRAKSALAVALHPQGNGAAVRWDNPETGRSGTFAATGAPFVRSDEICRAFTAVLRSGHKASTRTGTACREPEEWAIRDLHGAATS